MPAAAQPGTGPSTPDRRYLLSRGVSVGAWARRPGGSSEGCRGFFPDDSAHRLGVPAHGEGASAVSGGLTAEQLGELEPGDPVTIETAVTGRRPSLATGTVVRTEPTGVIVAVPGRGGRGTYIERYSRRNGVRVGRGPRAQLVDVSSDDRAGHELEKQRTGHVDVLYRAWSRRRNDVDALRQLHAAIEELLQKATPAS